MSRELSGHIAMMGFAALVAGSFAFGALIGDQMSPLVVTAFRFTITVVLLGVLAWPALRKGREAFNAPWRYLVLGASPALYFIFMFEALKTAPAVSLSVEFTLTPLVTGVFGYFLLNQIPTRRVLLALLIGALGAVWVIFRGDLSQLMAFHIGRGEVIFLVGMTFYALYAPLVRRLKRDEPPVVFTFAITLGALVVTLPFAFKGLVTTDYSAVPLTVWAVVFYLAVFASAATFSLIQFATLRLPSVKVMAHTYLIPSWVIFWQLVMGNGGPTAYDMIGVALTVLALVLLLKTQG
ncbi:DMT family transporter [Lentibacter algarum]|uniref:DMT family transporter n=1 Tax=Lentibacter algarum TaxID=576131 RepID=UPI001C071644|nr:DMT family transporter [Lentibacter algarum]